jgi:hypothetical protein
VCVCVCVCAYAGGGLGGWVHACVCVCACLSCCGWSATLFCCVRACAWIHLVRGGEEDEQAPLTDKRRPSSADDTGEDGIEQKKRKKRQVQYPLLADVSDAAQIVKFAGIKFLIFFVVFIMGFMVQAMPDKIIVCNQQYVVALSRVVQKHVYSIVTLSAMPQNAVAFCDVGQRCANTFTRSSRQRCSNAVNWRRMLHR